MAIRYVKNEERYCSSKRQGCITTLRHYNGNIKLTRTGLEWLIGERMLLTTLIMQAAEELNLYAEIDY